jgi:hypothetical protein
VGEITAHQAPRIDADQRQHAVGMPGMLLPTASTTGRIAAVCAVMLEKK